MIQSVEIWVIHLQWFVPVPIYYITKALEMHGQESSRCQVIYKPLQENPFWDIAFEI